MTKKAPIVTAILAVSFAAAAAFSSVAVGTPDPAATHQPRGMEQSAALPDSLSRSDQPVYHRSLPLRVADAASCKKACQGKFDRCENRCEDLYGDSPQGERLQEHVRERKAHLPQGVLMHSRLSLAFHAASR